MGVTEAVLALLDAGPSHGYGIKTAFEQATAHAWELNVGQVYSALQRLERHGLVVAEDADGERRRYRLTDDGRARVQRWLLDDAVAHHTGERDEVAMKLLLAPRTALADVREVLAAQRDATMAQLQAHTRAKAQERDGATWQRLLHLDRLILRCRAELDWLDLVEQRIETQPPADDDPRPDTPDAESPSTSTEDRA